MTHRRTNRAVRIACVGLSLLLSAVAVGQDNLAQFVVKGEWQAGEQYYEKAIIDAFQQGETPDFREVAELYRSYSICRYFPYLDQRTLADFEQRQMINWLWKHLDFTYKLLLAFQPEDNPASAFEVLFQLLKEDSGKVASRPQLAIAYSVVWDVNRAATLTLDDSWGYFTDSRTDLTYRLRAMPYQLSKHVIDIERDESQLAWAQEKFSGEGNMGRLYDNIWKDKYDRDAFYEGTPPEIASHENTLENIRQYGGVCIHAAQYAAGIGKAVGVPTVIITGSSEAGIGHAWIAYVRSSGRPAPLKWDRDSGRIGDDDAIVGRFTDPQTGRSLPEHELDLSVLVLATRSGKRMEADIWRGVAQLLAEEGQGPQAAWAIERSLEAAVYDKAQWATYADLVRRRMVQDSDAVKMADHIAGKLDDWPGLAVDAYEAVLLATGGLDARAKLKLADDMAGDFHRSEYVQARTALLKGKVLELAGEAEDAAEVYAEAVEDAMETALSLDLLDHAGRVYVGLQDLERAIDLHEDAWGWADRPGREHAYIRYTTWFQVGLRLAALYSLADDADEAEDTIDKIVRRTGGDSDQRDRLEDELLKVGYHAINQTRAPQPDAR